MRKIVAVIVLVLMLAAYSHAAILVARQYFTNKTDVIVAWDAMAEPDLAGFRLYGVPAATPTDAPTVININDPAATSYTWTNYPIGSYIHWMTAYDKYGNESDPSDYIQANKKVAKPRKVPMVRITNANFVISVQ